MTLLRCSTTLLLGLGAGALLPGAAAAGPSVPISIEDRGAQVAILIAGGRTSTRPESHSDRLELTLDQPLPAMELRLEYATVRRIEIRAQPPSVRVQLRHGTDSTRLSAEMAELRQLGDTLEILIPREPRQVAEARRAAIAGQANTAATTAAPAPIRAPVPAPGIAMPVPSPAPSPTPSSTIETPAPTTANAPTTGATPLPAGPLLQAGDAAAPARRAGDLVLDRKTSDGSGTTVTTLALAALAALAVGAWLWHRRRRSLHGLTSPLEILAQVTVGPRARVVWLSAGKREMLISVSDKDIRVLGQWVADPTRAVDTGAGPIGPVGPVGPTEDSTEPRGGVLPHARLRRNPSLSGLLRLREQHAAVDSGPEAAGEPPIEDVGEPDAEWARQLVAATRRGVLR